MVNQRKKNAFAKIDEIFNTRNAFVFVEFRAMTAEISSLLKRRMWQEKDCDFIVVKNNIAKKVLEKNNIVLKNKSTLKDNMMLFYSSDIILLVKSFYDFMKKYKDCFVVRFGIEDNNCLIDSEKLDIYSSMPSIFELQCSMVNLLHFNVLSNIINTINNPVSNICQSLNYIQNKVDS